MNSIVQHAYAKLWILRRLKGMGASRKSMMLVYYRHIRSLLEYGALAWGNSITIGQSSRIERVQRVTLRIICGNEGSYSKLLKKNKLVTLKHRREKQSLSFAKKALKHKKFSNWFQAEKSNKASRVKYAECVTRQRRLANSPIPYLTGLLNRNNGY